MKTIKLFSILIVCLTLTSSLFAQKEKTDSFRVSGECNMCKKKIEKAAKEAGASFASWSTATKILTVTYNTSSGAIQQAIANAGYDTPNYKATEAAYKALDECCQYERDKAVTKCCDGEKCEKKDGQCSDAAVCKEKGCGDMSCCKKS